MKRIPMLSQLFRKIGKQIGVEVELEPQWGVVGRLTYPNGLRRFFRYTTIDINTMGASEIAKDKSYAKLFMEKEGIPLIPGGCFCSPAWARKIGSKDTEAKALALAKKLKFPVIVKPNSKSQGARVWKVHDQWEFGRAFNDVAQIDNMILVEKFMPGRDYRIVVLDDKVISAYERVPLSVTGDGKSTVMKLLQLKQKQFEKIGRDTCIDMEDLRMIENLRRRGMSRLTVLPRGEHLQLLDNSNLSCGGDSVDVTKTLNREIANLAVRATKVMGLRLCGVDVMLEHGHTVSLLSQAHAIIEINSAPGLDHYAAIGKAQQKVVEELYREVIIAMGKKHTV